MQVSLAGLWQLSPLTDLSIPQDDLCFPAPLSKVLPDFLSEKDISAQEWHLMHDLEVDETLLAFPYIELVIAGVDYHAEVRLNGFALFDCNGTQLVYKKDIRPYLLAGRNRFEVLFLEEDDDLLFDEDKSALCAIDEPSYQLSDQRMGIWQEPYLQCIRYVHLQHVTLEQIWHHGGGCEVKVELYYQVVAAGLVSATVKFNGMTYQLPIDMRTKNASALFQVDAPKQTSIDEPESDMLYQLQVEIDGQMMLRDIILNPHLCVQHFPL